MLFSCEPTIQKTNQNEPSKTIQKTKQNEPNKAIQQTNQYEPNKTIQQTNQNEPNKAIQQTNQNESKKTKMKKTKRHGGGKRGHSKERDNTQLAWQNNKRHGRNNGYQNE
jgi:hypothetical protein